MKEKFIPTNNDLSYYPLLYMALEATEGDIVEMGMGHGSTPILHDYAGESKRHLSSYESNMQWFLKFKEMRSDGHSVAIVTDWDVASEIEEKPSVVFIDHAPGERRKVDIPRFKDSAEIIVVHDTEPTGAGDYRVRPLFNDFKYCVEVKNDGAWATALSDTIDITKWVGEKFGDYEISEKDPR